MNAPNCCASPQLSPDKVDLGHADSLEYMLETCSNCGARWMNVFSVATSAFAHVRVSAEDAAVMLAAERGPQLKNLMREWGNKNV